MKHSMRLLVMCALLTTAAGVVAPTPAYAGVDECTGTGTMVLPVGFGIPPAPPVTTNFHLDLTGACTSGATTMTANGTITGHCGAYSGYGTASVNSPHAAPQGHVFSINNGTLTGQVTGMLTLVEDPLDASSCTNGTATRFIVTGTAAFTHTVSAGFDECTGTGQMVLNVGFGFFPPPNTAAFSLALTGACASGATTVTAQGILDGYCGAYSGYGTARVGSPHAPPEDHDFTINNGWLTGQVTGFVTLVEDPFDASSCLTKTATNFFATGAAEFTHTVPCVVTTTPPLLPTLHPVHTCA